MSSSLIAAALFYSIGYALFRAVLNLPYTWQRFLLGFFVVWVCTSLTSMIAVSKQWDSVPHFFAIVWSAIVLFAFLIQYESEESNREAKTDVPPSAGIERNAAPVSPTVSAEKHADALSASSSDEERAYEEAWSEIETGNLRTGIWAKSFSEAEGDEKKAKASYIQYRVKQIIDLHSDSDA